MEVPSFDPQSREKLLARVKNIIMTPSAEWDVIDQENDSIGGIYARHVFILAAIGPIATFIHSVLFGYSFLGITYRPGLMGSLGTAIITYLLSLATVFVLALVIDALAPSFGTTSNRVQAFKVAAYSSTAAWVAGLFNLLPGIGFLSFLGLYSLYLMYLGLPKLMKAPEDKGLAYTVVSILASVVVFVVAGALVAPIAGMFGGSGPAIAESSSVSGTVSVPGVGSVDVGKLEETANKLEKDLKAGEGKQVAASELQALLPSAIAGMARKSVEAQSAGAAGISGSNVSATYEGTDGMRINLDITDMSVAGALAGLGSALNVESSRETENGYERTSTIDGRMTTENWDKNTKSGSYSVVVANRFMVKADGDGVEMDALKSAVAAIGLDALERLAK